MLGIQCFDPALTDRIIDYTIPHIKSPNHDMMCCFTDIRLSSFRTVLITVTKWKKPMRRNTRMEMVGSFKTVPGEMEVFTFLPFVASDYLTSTGIQFKFPFSHVSCFNYISEG